MSDDVEIQALFPDTAHQAIEFRVPESAYRFLLLERSFAATAEGTHGNYLLLGPAPGENGAWTFYVGKVGTGTVSQRIASHLKDKSWWNRVLVVLPGAWNDSFSSASAGFLRGSALRSPQRVPIRRAQNSNTPGDEIPTERERHRLRKGVLPNVTAILRLLGYDVSTGRLRPQDTSAAGSTPLTPPLLSQALEIASLESTAQPIAQRAAVPSDRPQRKSLWATMGDLVARGYLHDGETLHGTSGAPSTVRANGSLVVDGEVCWSPNRAWEVATNPAPGKTQNAWRFWRVSRDDVWKPIWDLRDEYEARFPEDQRSR